MTADREVPAVDAHAPHGQGAWHARSHESARQARSPESGWQARWHTAVTQRSSDVALAAVPVPLRVLDVGCGAGALVRELSERLPNVLELIGVDPDEAALGQARELADGRARFVRASAERLPFPDGRFDLVVSTLSLHHWGDQPAGLAEAARVLAEDGHVVLVDQFRSRFWRGNQPGGVRPTLAEIRSLLTDAGLRVERRETIRRLGPPPFVRAFIASP
jgi:ubiquinone/menaquinone biosynthesis C-methylase UbiE